MEETLRLLVRLQRLDEKVTIQDRRLASIPIELGEREAGFAAREAAVGQLEADRKSCLIRAQDLENDVVQAEQRIARLEQQTRESRDASSITVANHEADQLRTKVASWQDEALSLLEEAEVLAERRHEAQAKLDEEAAELEAFRATVTRDQAELAGILEEFRAQRGEIAKALNSNLVKEFDRIAAARKGKAVVPLKGNSCGGCGMGLKPNDQMRVEQGNAVVTCASCGRMLIPMKVWQDEV